VSAETYSLYKQIYQQLTYLWLSPWFMGGTVLGGLLLHFKLLSATWLDKLLNRLVLANFLLLIVVAISYLFYPSYLDHVESSIASLGLIYQQKDQIYPLLSEYSMHGLMYGPLLAETQAFFELFNLPVVLSSKLSGVAAFVCSSVLLLGNFKNNFSRSYLIFLIPFGMFNYWNRAEPIFILLVTLTLILVRQSTIQITKIFFIGCLMGAASGLKIHAGIYIFAVILSRPELIKGWTLQRGFTLLAGLFIVLTAIYSPQQVSIFNFFSYLDLGRKHGISSTLLIENLAYISALLCPIIYLLIKGLGKKSKYFVPIILLIVVELVVVLIASKPGAGSHHLMPFIPIHAALIQDLLDEIPAHHPPLLQFKFGLLIIGFMSFITPLVLVGKIIMQYPLQSELKKEIEIIKEKYPGIVLAPSDTKSYSFVYLRPVLEKAGSRQVDYPALMDLKLSGVSDDALSVAMRQCSIPYLALPVEGEPLALNSYYTNRPLFSDSVRSTFQELYKPVIPALMKHYVVFACDNK
jgi:hypothetical protein